jgi:hypothetical protein
VPATRQTDRLMGYLPVPQVVPAEGSTSAYPHARLRVVRPE